MAAFPSIRSFLAAFPAVIWSLDCMRTHPGISGSSYTSFVLPSLTFLPSFRSRGTKNQSNKIKTNKKVTFASQRLVYFRTHSRHLRVRGDPALPDHEELPEPRPKGRCGHVSPSSAAESPLKAPAWRHGGRASRSRLAPAALTAARPRAEGSCRLSGAAKSPPLF